MTKYFFTLGNHRDISIAEISAVLEVLEIKTTISVCKSGDVLLVETAGSIDAGKMIRRLGGTIKIGIVAASCETKLENILEAINRLPFPETETKLNFGVSFYGKKKLDQKEIGMETKKILKQKGYHCRWVTSREKTLSSVVVEQNKLIDGGLEIIIIETEGGCLIGHTIAVQPFKELSARDYGRPARDDASGMLPPKLAQILINLSGAAPGDAILDPFCGSGTILTEAALMDYQNLIGSDLSIKAVRDSLKNFNWIKEGHGLKQDVRLYNISATETSKVLRPGSVDAIVTEPYLGPQQGFADIDKSKRELDELYSKALREFRKILKPGGRIVMIWPILNADGRQVSVTPKTDGYENKSPQPPFTERGYTSPRPPFAERGHASPQPSSPSSADKSPKGSDLIYKREGQRVWRRIVILEKR